MGDSCLKIRVWKGDLLKWLVWMWCESDKRWTRKREREREHSRERERKKETLWACCRLSKIDPQDCHTHKRAYAYTHTHSLSLSLSLHTINLYCVNVIFLCLSLAFSPSLSVSVSPSLNSYPFLYALLHSSVAEYQGWLLKLTLD